MILSAFCSASGPQNGWNDPPTLHRVPKKKKASFITRNDQKCKWSYNLLTPVPSRWLPLLS